MKIEYMKPKFLILAFFSVLLLNCSNDDKNNDECIKSETVFVTSVNAPDSVSLGELINIEVEFQVYSGCGGFGRFIETENGNIRRIEVQAKYVGCICTDNAPVITTNYTFSPNTKGNYILKFKSGENDFITANIIVE